MRRLWHIGSSWWLTAALAAVGVALYVVFGFFGDPWSGWVGIVFHSALGVTLYLLCAANLIMASVRVITERLREPVATVETVNAMDASKEIPGMTLDRAEVWLRERGFSKVARTGSGIVARKGVWAFIPGTLLRAGIVITMIAALVSIHARVSEERITHPGEPVTLLGSEIKVISINAPLPTEFLKLGEADVFRLTGVSLEAVLGGGRVTVGGGSPTPVNGMDLRVTHIGYTAMLSDNSPAVDLDVLPPGRSALVKLADGETAAVTLLPQSVIRKGLLKGDSYDLTAPLFGLKLQTGSGAATLTPKYSLYAKLRAVRDPALPWLRVGLWLSLVGFVSMLLRAFWFERRAMAVLTPEGAVILGYEEEYYRKWGVYRFARWTDGIT